MASMPSSSLAFFKVNRCEPELVTPLKPTPKELKLLSDIDDQEGLRFQIPLIFFYKNSNNDKPSVKLEEDPIRVIREALGKALVYYYPFAGRLREGSNKKLMVDCTGEGVLFVAAKADVELKQLGDAIRPPCPFLDEFLYNVPGSDGILDCPLLLIQVTQLKCGGFALAVRLNHTMCDAFGLVQFLNTVAEMARGKNTPSTPPVWQREILNARNPPRITCTHHEHQQIPSSSNGSNNKNMVMDPNDVVQCSFFFSPNQIMNMRRQLPKHLQNCSRFELITACMWKCRTIALGLDPEETVRISCLTSIRGNKNVKDLSLPSGYYGNAFAYPAVVSTARVLCESPLGFTVELVKKAKAQMNEDYIMSVASLMVIRGRPLYVVSGNYIVSDNMRTGFGEVDFGWGFPVFGGPAMALSLISFHVSYEERGEIGVVVPICLPTEIAMERFGQELKKITNHDLEAKPYKVCELKGFKISSSL